MTSVIKFNIKRKRFASVMKNHGPEDFSQAGPIIFWKVFVVIGGLALFEAKDHKKFGLAHIRG